MPFNNMKIQYPQIHSKLALCSQMLLSYIIFVKGLGIREFYDISVFSLLAVLFYIGRSKVRRIFYIALMIFQLTCPSLFLLWGVLIMIFCLGNDLRIFGILAGIFWILEECDIVITSVMWITIFFFIAIFVWILLKKWENKVLVPSISFILILCTSLTFLNLPFYSEKLYSEKYIPSTFSPSEVFCRVTNTEYIDNANINANTRVIRSTPFLTKIDKEQPGIFVHEITEENLDPVVIHEVWQQPISWFDNQMIGKQYYLEAIRRDGGLYSNKGLTLREDSGCVLLSYIESFTHSQPLIVKYGKTLYLHDSDYSSSYLANYQKNFLNELASNTIRPNLIRFINLLFVALLFVLLFHLRYKKVISVMIIGAILSIVWYLDYYPKRGEIRIVGKITNSHENNKFDGVVKTIVNAGYDYIIGDKNSKILIVQKGKSATVKSEDVVIAEDECSITINGVTAKVINNPIGNVNGVIDARQWFYLGKIYDGILIIDDVKLIATGSPALQSWKDFIK